MFYFDLWSHNAKDLINEERNRGKLHSSWFTHQIIRFSIFFGHIDNCGYMQLNFQGGYDDIITWYNLPKK